MEMALPITLTKSQAELTLRNVEASGFQITGLRFDTFTKAGQPVTLNVVNAMVIDDMPTEQVDLITTTPAKVGDRAAKAVKDGKAIILVTTIYISGKKKLVILVR
ncbi:MAG: hypothetical protein V3W41_11615 [Planctomycetota bacterium]